MIHAIATATAHVGTVAQAAVVNVNLASHDALTNAINYVISIIWN
jgi:hypothetical protein